MVTGLNIVYKNTCWIDWGKYQRRDCGFVVSINSTTNSIRPKQGEKGDTSTNINQITQERKTQSVCYVRGDCFVFADEIICPLFALYMTFV